jgi:hypothetical protein
MSRPSSTKDMAFQNIEAISTEQSGQHGSVKEAHLTPEMPEALRGMTEGEIRMATRKLVRKLDLRLMAPLILMYIMNYLDRYSQSRKEQALCSDAIAEMQSQPPRYPASWTILTCLTRSFRPA